MAPKASFQIHSLNKHIEDTKKGLSGEAQFNRRLGGRGLSASMKEKTLPKTIFDQNTSDNDTSSSDDSSSSSSDESESDFVKKLGATWTTKPPAKEDEIADSDDGRSTSAQKAVLIKHIKSEAKSSDKPSDDTGSDESEPAIKASDSDSSSESEPDDDSDDGDGGDDGDGSDDSDAESEVSAKSEAKAVKAIKANERSKIGKEKVVAEKPPVNGEAVQSSSSSEAAQKLVESDRELVDESIHIEDRQGGNHVAPPPNLIAPDFMLRKSNEGALGEDVARICNQAQMDGKQFWYFTVPSKVPISVVQNLEIPMDNSDRGEHVFSHAGNDYGISFDRMTPKSSIQILIPTADGSQYQAAQQSVEQVMQVRRITKLGGGDSKLGGGDTALVASGPKPERSSVPQPERSSVPQPERPSVPQPERSSVPQPERSSVPQPEGLKASYQPNEVASPMNSIGMDGEDFVMTDAATSTPAAAPSQSEQVKPSKKKDKKKTAVVVEASKEVSTPRKGKRKHTTSEDDATAAAEQLIVESQEAESQSKKPKTGRSESPDLGSEPPSTAAKKKTMFVPPRRPGPSSSMVTMPTVTAEATTPKVAAKSGKSAKKAKKTSEKTPLPSSSQSVAPRIVTPAPQPRETPVPLPPGSWRLGRESPAPRVSTPAASGSKGDDKVKKRKNKDVETPKAMSGTNDEKTATKKPTGAA